MNERDNSVKEMLLVDAEIQDSISFIESTMPLNIMVTMVTYI